MPATSIPPPPRGLATVNPRGAAWGSPLGPGHGGGRTASAAATRGRLAALDYDFDALRAFMLERDLTTVQLVFREAPATFSVRDPFPVGGVVEDPATGAAAAAFGAYLRALGLVDPPATVTLHQGDDLGRPSVLTVAIPPGDAGIDVTGTAVRLP